MKKLISFRTMEPYQRISYPL